MKIVNTNIGIDIDLSNNAVDMLVIENPNVLSSVIYVFMEQIKDKEGNFVLSDGDKILDLDKKAEIIFNPFEIDLNSKKIITKLYERMQANGNDTFLLEKNELISELGNIIEKISLNIPSVALEYDYEKVWNEIFKFMGVRVQNAYGSLIESIINYINLLNDLCGVNLFIFVNLKSFVAFDEIVELYKYALYNNINLLMIESKESEKKSDKERIHIIDKDRCYIE